MPSARVVAATIRWSRCAGGGFVRRTSVIAFRRRRSPSRRAHRWDRGRRAATCHDPAAADNRTADSRASSFAIVAARPFAVNAMWSMTPAFNSAGWAAADDMQNRLAIRVEPHAGKIERRAPARGEPEKIAIERGGRVHVIGQDRKVIHCSHGHGRSSAMGDGCPFYDSASRTKSATIAVASGPCASLYRSASSPPLHAWPSDAIET